VELAFREIAIAIVAESKTSRRFVDVATSVHKQQYRSERSGRIEASDTDQFGAEPLPGFCKSTDEHRIVDQEQPVVAVRRRFGNRDLADIKSF